MSHGRFGGDRVLAACRRQCSASGKSSKHFKKLSSVHNLKFFVVSTLSVVAG
jgi:hypothetical protein